MEVTKDIKRQMKFGNIQSSITHGKGRFSIRIKSFEVSKSFLSFLRVGNLLSKRRGHVTLEVHGMECPNA